VHRRLLTGHVGRGARGALALAFVPVTALAAPAPARAGTTSSCDTRLSDRLAAFAQRHPSIDLAVAVADLTTGRQYAYRRHARQVAASIVKVEILEALLHRRPAGLSPRLSDLAHRMIEHSDNAAAQSLYERIGSARGLRAFGRLVGLRETAPEAGDAPGYAWGRTLTTPADQLRLLALLVRDNAVLSHGDRLFALRLMRHVESAQRWGVTSGTGNSVVAVKNGWLALRGWAGWQINSIGYVQGTARYLIAIESRGADTMAAGVRFADRVSSLVAGHC